MACACAKSIMCVLACVPDSEVDLTGKLKLVFTICVECNIHASCSGMWL